MSAAPEITLDVSDDLIQQVLVAKENNTKLKISGNGTKQHILGRDIQGDNEYQKIDVTPHQGIVSYDPTELVLTARSGTTLKEIEATLSGSSQMLSFEPPHFGESATLGGTLATNLSGPARPWGGSIRDMVLGVRLINGKGEHLRFGGQVMKNVAGYDASRLQAGAMGTLGIVTEVSLKVLPKPESTSYLMFEMNQSAALEKMSQLAATAKPITAAAWLDGVLHIRLSGAHSAVESTFGEWGGDLNGTGETFWQELREQTLGFFDSPEPLWRLSILPTAPILMEEPTLVDWAGGIRWYLGDYPLQQMEELAASHGGHVTLFRGGDRTGEVRQSLNKTHKKLQQGVKKAFDPDGIFNPGLLYSWM